MIKQHHQLLGWGEENISTCKGYREVCSTLALGRSRVSSLISYLVGGGRDNGGCFCSWGGMLREGRSKIGDWERQQQQLAHQLVQEGKEQERVGSDPLVQGIRGEGEPGDLVWEGSPPLPLRMLQEERSHSLSSSWMSVQLGGGQGEGGDEDYVLEHDRGEQHDHPFC